MYERNELKTGFWATSYSICFHIGQNDLKMGFLNDCWNILYMEKNMLMWKTKSDLGFCQKISEMCSEILKTIHLFQIARPSL